ncbi:MAG: ATP-grasp domain-containing protein [Spirochaetaceae bacterium]|nr:ATP-grasp domain-containing protein [Spirochaetaceae bacterium]
MGFWTAALDGNPEAPFRLMADYFEQIDLKDKELILNFAKKLAGEPAGLCGIMTCGTDFSPSVAYTAERLNLPGISYETALKAQDKELMRSVFEKAGIASPRWKAVHAPCPDVFSLDFEFPVVVKPADNMGARGCRRVDSTAGLKDAVLDALRYSRSSKAIIEEYMEGPEFSVDALVFNGEVTICGLAERHIFYPPYFIEMGHTMPAVLSARDETAVLDLFCAGIKALGINCGAAKGDIKLTRRGAMIGEIAARLSGGYMSGWTYPYSSGAEPVRGALCIAAGEAPFGITPVKNWTSAERAFISIPGVISAIHGIEEAKKIPYVKDVFLRVKPGDTVDFPQNNVSKCGNVISAAPEREQAIKAAEAALRCIVIELEANNPATDAFLDSPLETAFPPSVFYNYESMAAFKQLNKAEDYAGSGVDYTGRSKEETLLLVKKLFGKAPPCSDEFNRAFLRGGYQGALYYLKTKI